MSKAVAINLKHQTIIGQNVLLMFKPWNKFDQVWIWCKKFLGELHLESRRSPKDENLFQSSPKTPTWNLGLISTNRTPIKRVWIRQPNQPNPTPPQKLHQDHPQDSFLVKDLPMDFGTRSHRKPRWPCWSNLGWKVTVIALFWPPLGGWIFTGHH